VDLFLSPRLKLDRAYSHIQELESLTKPLSKTLYEIKVEPEFAFPKPYAISMTLTYKPTKPIAETLGLIIGDVVNNFRSALDHLASGIVRENNSSARPFFPMCKKRNELPSNKFLPVIEQALPGSTELLLKKIRPDEVNGVDLWCFHLLDNDSKHNLILPTVSAVSIDNINLVSGGMRMTNCGVNGDATQPINILKTGGDPIQIQQGFDVSVDFRFPADSIFPILDVLETLNRIGSIVAETIDSFEELYLRKSTN
jgi:hypothetical protein